MPYADFQNEELNSWRIIFEHRLAFSCYREQEEFAVIEALDFLTSISCCQYFF